MRFLTRTSVLDRMCGGLCDAVLERHDSAIVLESLERSNRFLVPLDRSRTWYRYHHLFRDLLRSELQHREPEIAPELNSRATAWCQTNRLAEAALQYAHEAGETDAAARLIEQLALPTYFGGGLATLETWLHWYDDLLDRYPTIAVLGAWVYVLTGRPVEGARWERAAQQSTATPELPDGSASIEPWIATLRAYTCRGGIEQMVADSERARPALELAAELTAAAGAPDEGSVAFAELALLAMEAGAWEQAAGHARRGVALVDEAQLHDYLACGLAMAAAARVAVHEGDLTTARGHVAKVHRLRPLFNHGLPWLSVQTGLELTRVHLALGEASVARAVLSESEDILRVRPHLGTLGEQARGLRQRVAASSSSGGAWALTLTASELRLLPLLITHLAFPQIGERLFLSRNTIKTHAISIYRKFGVSSRAEAIERAVELGLLEDSLYPARANTALRG